MSNVLIYVILQNDVFYLLQSFAGNGITKENKKKYPIYINYKENKNTFQ